MSSRLNARVDDELARRVEELSRATGTSASAIIKAALEAYLEEAGSRAQTTPRRALEQTGLIGCASGDADLSHNYKQSLADSLGWKA